MKSFLQYSHLLITKLFSIIVSNSNFIWSSILSISVTFSTYDRIQKNINKNKNKISQKALKRIKKYDINKRNKREFKLLKNFQTT